MSIKRIRCKKRCSGLWCSWVTADTPGSHILCDDKANEWWDIEGAEEIYVTLSNKPHAGAYRVALRLNHLRILIQAENGEGTCNYQIFAGLSEELKKLNAVCYLGVRIIK